MENEEEKLDTLLHELIKTVPELTGSEMLTEKIMQKIKEKTIYRIPAVLIWIRAVSGSAAILLLGLFLFQQNETTAIASTPKPSGHPEIRINIDSACLKNLNNPASNIMASYMCHLQQNSIKNKLYKTIDQQLKN